MTANTENEAALEAALAELPRVDLASVRPTPLEPMPRLSEALGGPDLYVKRDDLTGLAFGGNKTRMFEFALADALATDAEVLVHGAAVQSNYCRQLAAACAHLGLDLELYLRPVRPVDHDEVTGNHLLMRLCGADVTILDDGDDQREVIADRVAALEDEGRAVYWPRRGDTIDLDALAYAETSLEIVRQCRGRDIDPGYCYVASSDTTQAGLELGLRALDSDTRVRGFAPSAGDEGRREEMARIANQGADRVGLDVAVDPDDLWNDDSFVGERYGLPTEGGLEAVRTTARTEGVLLDPVYTGKAMAGLFAHVRDGRLGPDDGPVVFVHTGGQPALFAYADAVLEDRP